VAILFQDTGSLSAWRSGRTRLHEACVRGLGGLRIDEARSELKTSGRYSCILLGNNVFSAKMPDLGTFQMRTGDRVQLPNIS
jgi:hypothetical protein